MDYRFLALVSEIRYGKWFGPHTVGKSFEEYIPLAYLKFLTVISNSEPPVPESV